MAQLGPNATAYLAGCLALFLGAQLALALAASLTLIALLGLSQVVVLGFVFARAGLLDAVSAAQLALDIASLLCALRLVRHTHYVRREADKLLWA